MRDAGLVQVRERRACAAKKLKDVRNVREPEPRQTCTHGLPRYPAAQVARAAAGVSIRCPVVVSRRNRGMTLSRQLLGLLEKPRGVRGIGRGHQGQGAPQRIDHLLIVPIVADHSARAPGPFWGQLPINEMRRQNLGCAGRHYSTIHPAQASLRTSTINTLVPFPSSLAMAISPPHASISRRLTASPSPLPVVRVEKCGSKIRGNTAGAMPAPLSTVSIVTLPSSSRSEMS